MEITITTKRPCGKTETVDVSEKFTSMTAELLTQVAVATHNAGRGEVIFAEVTRISTNLAELRREWINLHNEGGDGFVPDSSYFEGLDRYREWVETQTIKSAR